MNHTHPINGNLAFGAPDPAPATAPQILVDLLAKADIHLNGDRPWDIQIHDPATYQRILSQGSLGFGEAYMDGLWDAVQLDQLFERLFRADINRDIRFLPRLRLLLASLASTLQNRLINRQTGQRAYEVGRRHYDIGNDIYQAMLDPSMSYSCGYWAEADNLIDAQLAKLRSEEHTSELQSH